MREGGGCAKAVCLPQESSDDWVIGSDLLLRSCGGFQGEQKNTCLHRKALFGDG